MHGNGSGISVPPTSAGKGGIYAEVHEDFLEKRFDEFVFCPIFIYLLPDGHVFFLSSFSYDMTQISHKIRHPLSGADKIINGRHISLLDSYIHLVSYSESKKLG